MVDQRRNEMKKERRDRCFTEFEKMAQSIRRDLRGRAHNMPMQMKFSDFTIHPVGSIFICEGLSVVRPATPTPSTPSLSKTDVGISMVLVSNYIHDCLI